MISCTRLLRFDAGHRVLGHEGKCAALHGHGYVVELHATAKSLDSVGRIIDFSVLKEKIGDWIDKFWDHGCILYVKDFDAIRAVRLINSQEKTFSASFNPTAENIANYLLTEVCPSCLNKTDVKVVKVVVWETPNCFATATLDD